MLIQDLTVVAVWWLIERFVTVVIGIIAVAQSDAFVGFVKII